MFKCSTGGLLSLSKRAVVTSCLLALGMGCFYFAILLPRAHAVRSSRDLMRGYVYGCDFYPLWFTSGELLSHRTNPYTAEMTTRIQLGLFGRTMDPNRPGDPLQNLAVYPHPLYSDFLVAPLAFFRFSTVQVLGSLLFPGLVVVGVLLWLHILHLQIAPSAKFSLMALVLTSYPILEGVYALQLTLLVAALIAGSVAMLVKGNLTWAGILLGIASVKPQLIFLPALFLALWAASDLRNRKTLLISFAATVALLFFASEAVLPGSSATWIRALLEYRHYNDAPLSQFIFGRAAGNFITFLLLATAVIVAFRVRMARAGSPQFIATLILLLAISVPTISSSIAVYNQILLVPAILRLFSRKSEGHSVVVYSLGVVIFWQYITASTLALYTLVFSRSLNATWMLLPLRTAPSLPFVAIALCLFVGGKANLFTPPQSAAAV
jgi:hypothetical protein